jgi:hypothetical protein
VGGTLLLTTFCTTAFCMAGKGLFTWYQVGCAMGWLWGVHRGGGDRIRGVGEPCFCTTGQASGVRWGNIPRGCAIEHAEGGLVQVKLSPGPGAHARPRTPSRAAPWPRAFLAPLAQPPLGSRARAAHFLAILSYFNQH